MPVFKSKERKGEKRREKERKGEKRREKEREKKGVRSNTVRHEICART